MSLTLVRHSEEFPELTAAWQAAFEKPAAAPSAVIAPRTAPSFFVEADFDSADGILPVAFIASTEFALAALIKEPAISIAAPALRAAPSPAVRSFTMEDGGQDLDTQRVSEIAAVLLSNYDAAPVAAAREAVPA